MAVRIQPDYSLTNPAFVQLGRVGKSPVPHLILHKIRGKQFNSSHNPTFSGKFPLKYKIRVNS